jgi:transcriptional regulator with XRE-family HTH domain
MSHKHVGSAGVKIRAARLARGFTLTDVSAGTGFSAAFLSNCERGLIPKRCSLQTIADFCGVDISCELAQLTRGEVA